MNIFGMFFTFMVPGILLGLLASAVIAQRQGKSRRTQPAAKRSLYMHDLRGGADRAA